MRTSHAANIFNHISRHFTHDDRRIQRPTVRLHVTSTRSVSNYHMNTLSLPNILSRYHIRHLLEVPNQIMRPQPGVPLLHPHRTRSLIKINNILSSRHRNLRSQIIRLHNRFQTNLTTSPLLPLRNRLTMRVRRPQSNSSPNNRRRRNNSPSTISSPTPTSHSTSRASSPNRSRYHPSRRHPNINPLPSHNTLPCRHRSSNRRNRTSPNNTRAQHQP